MDIAETYFVGVLTCLIIAMVVVVSSGCICSTSCSSDELEPVGVVTDFEPKMVRSNSFGSTTHCYMDVVTGANNTIKAINKDSSCSGVYIGMELCKKTSKDKECNCDYVDCNKK